jgi:hypothetical protein
MGHIRDRFGVGSRSPATATVSATDRTATQHPNSSGSDRDSNQSRGPARSRLRWIHGGVGFQPAHGPPAFGETAARRAGCPPHHGKHRHGRSVGSGDSDSDSDSGSVRGRFSEQRRGPRRPRIPDTATGHGVGDGRECSGTLGSPAHRPAVAFGACRAFVPARRPAVARVDLLTRTVSATFGRLDGLLGGCGNLLRQAIPGGAPHGIVPIGTRTQSAQYRVLHARRCATSRVQQCPRTHLQIAWGGGSECRGGPPFPPRKSSDRGSGRVSGSVAPETAWSVTVSEIRVRWPVSAIGLQAPMLFVVAVTVTVSVPVPSAVLLPLAGLRFTGDPGDASGSSLAVTQLR